MSLLDMYVEKVAAEYDENKELELIKRAQSGDKLAYKQLAKMFSGAIESGISKSGVNLPNVSKETLRMKAMGEFRRSIEVFDPNAGAKPSSFIIGNIAKDLQKLDRKYKNPSRVSDPSTLKMGNVATAMKQLEAEGVMEPSSQQISDMIKRNFDKDILPDEVDSLLARQRTELSGGKTIGSEEEAEEINFGDVMNVDQVSGQDLLKQQEDQDKMNELIGTLDETSQKIYNQAKGFGEFKEVGPAKFSEVAKSNNLGSEYFAKKEIARIEDALAKQLNNDGQ